jgi:Ependymin
LFCAFFFPGSAHSVCHVSSYDEKHHWRAGINVSFDFSGKKLAFEIHERHAESSRRILSEIVDFNTKTAYSVNWDDKSCQTHTISHEMEKDCTPADAKLEGRPVIGGALKAYLYAFEFGSGEQSIRGMETRASHNCVPIESALINKKWGVDQTSYFDYTTGIKDAGVFTPPAFCHHNSSTAATENTDLAVSKFLRLSGDMTEFRALVPKFVREISDLRQRK